MQEKHCGRESCVGWESESTDPPTSWAAIAMVSPSWHSRCRCRPQSLSVCLVDLRLHRALQAALVKSIAVSARLNNSHLKADHMYIHSRVPMLLQLADILFCTDSPLPQLLHCVRYFLNARNHLDSRRLEFSFPE